MRILYDYQVLGQIYGGISRYFYQIIKEIEQYDNVLITLPVMFANNYYFKEKLGYKPCMRFGNRPFNNILTIKELMCARLQRKPYDIVHPTYYSPDYIRFKGKAKLIITIHDMTAEVFYPEQKKEIEDKRRILEKADGIVAISEYTKNDMLGFYPHLSEKKIKVIYHGSNLCQKKEKVNVPSKYILYVGNRLEYKNFNVMIKAFSLIHESYPDLQLVCAGGGKFTREEEEKIDNLGIKSKVSQISATDGELFFLYSNAKMFVFPSLYEGFGIPILEAFECKCPVILSNCTCFPEVAKDAAVYFEGEDASNLADRIEDVLLNDKLRRTLVDKGTKRLKHFQWSETAKQTYEFYKEVLSDG